MNLAPGTVPTTRIDAVRRKAVPAYDVPLDPELVDIEAWNHVGDPIAEDLVGLLRERRLMGGDILATARRLRAEGCPEADAFFADVEFTPGWVDFDAMRPGADMGLRHPVGLALSLHGVLPFTYIDGSVATVMASTGRLTHPGADFRRRFWESAAAFAGAFDVDGMRPGGRRWEEWVRVRLLHTMIRMGIQRSGRWDGTHGVPISQAPTAAGAHLFGAYRLNIIRHLGGRVSDEEAHGYNLMWRWIARIQGANVELLGSTDAEQLRLNQRIARALYRPTADSRAATAAVVDGLSGMKSIFPVSRGVHVAVMCDLLSPEMLQVLPDVDVPAALGLREHRRPVVATAAVKGIDRALTRVLAALPRKPERWQRDLDEVVEARLRGRPTYAATPVAGDAG